MRMTMRFFFPLVLHPMSVSSIYGSLLTIKYACSYHSGRTLNIFVIVIAGRNYYGRSEIESLLFREPGVRFINGLVILWGNAL